MKIIKALLISILIIELCQSLKVKNKIVIDETSNYFDRETALRFTKNMARELIQLPDDTEAKASHYIKIFDDCFLGFVEDPAEFIPILKNFWDKCYNIRDNFKAKWSVSMFQNTIMNKLSTVRTKEGIENSTCQAALPYKTEQSINALEKVFNATFKAFVPTPANATKFISSMFSVHRRALPDYAFVRMNRESGVSSSKNDQIAQTSTFKDLSKAKKTF